MSQAKEQQQLTNGASKSRIKNAELEKKTLLKRSLEGNKVIPTTSQKDALKMQGSLKCDDAQKTARAEDDEYRWTLVGDPKIAITTSTNPSVKLKQFSKELKLVFPNSLMHTNRGKYSFKEMIEACKAHGATDLIMVTETRGDPDGLIVSHLPQGPTALFGISDSVLRRDIKNVGTMPQEYPHLIFQNFKTKLGKRVESILEHLFPIPKGESTRVISFLNNDDWIMFRQHSYSDDEHQETQLVELGPRFFLRLYEIKRGTIDEFDSADVEWALPKCAHTAVQSRCLSKDSLFPE